MVKIRWRFEFKCPDKCLKIAVEAKYRVASPVDLGILLLRAKQVLDRVEFLYLGIGQLLPFGELFKSETFQ